MYLPTRTVTLERPAAPAGETAPSPSAGPRTPRRRSWRGLNRNVYLLGLTSLVTDISSEMVTVVLPIYLLAVYGFGPAQIGAFDGIYTGLAAVVCVAAAMSADRRQRHKRVATVGYAVSSLSKLGLLLAAGRWVPTAGALYVDRLGKGIRTAPRDAILSLSTRRTRLAEAFGVHRTLDTVGAILGPVVAALVLARDPNGFGAVFAISFLVSVIGVGILVLLVDDRRVQPTRVSDRHRPASDRWSALTELRTDPTFRTLCTVSAVLALATPGDAIIFLAIQQSSGLGAAAFPLLFVAASVVFVVTAVPVGRLADRIGRARVLLAGELALVAALAVLAVGPVAPTGVALFVALIGLHLAATDGVLMSLVSAHVAAAARTTGLAVVVTIVALATVVSSAAFGLVWARAGTSVAATTFAFGLVVAVGISAWRLRRLSIGSLP
jgi:MFS family permease